MGMITIKNYSMPHNCYDCDLHNYHECDLTSESIEEDYCWNGDSREKHCPLREVEAIPKDNVYKAIQEMMKYEHEGFINISLARLDEILKKCGVEDGNDD